MTGKLLRELQKRYPHSRFHCEVKIAGSDAYYVIASLLDQKGREIAHVMHYGREHHTTLDALKREAFEMLATKLDNSIEV